MSYKMNFNLEFSIVHIQNSTYAIHDILKIGVN